MENTGLKGLLKTLYQRVVLSYKTTLIGLGVVVLGTVADELAKSPSKILTIVASVVGGILILIKQKFPTPPPSDPPPAA